MLFGLEAHISHRDSFLSSLLCVIISAWVERNILNWPAVLDPWDFHSVNRKLKVRGLKRDVATVSIGGSELTWGWMRHSLAWREMQFQFTEEFELRLGFFFFFFLHLEFLMVSRFHFDQCFFHRSKHKCQIERGLVFLLVQLVSLWLQELIKLKYVSRWVVLCLQTMHINCAHP